MVEIDPDLCIYKISHIQVDTDPHTILNFKDSEADIAGISVEKTHYPKGTQKIVALCRRHILSLFCKKERPLNRAKNFLARQVSLITHILNFIIQFNQSVTKESSSFPTMTFKNFDCYWYNKQLLSYWYSSRFDVAGLDNHACISHLKTLQMGVKKYKNLSLPQM